MAQITQIQLRRDTAADWTTADPTLAAGEVGYESDTNKLKIGDGSTAWTSLAYFGGTGVTNLGYTSAASGGTVTSDTGTNASLIDATASLAGLMVPAQFTKLSNITVTQAVDLDQLEAESANLVTLSGVASDSVNLGTFTGSTIADNVTVKTALQSLETQVELLEGGLVYKGNWDASAGTFPGGGTAQQGHFYVVSVAGTVDSVSFAVGDKIYATVDNASTSTYASNWDKVDTTDEVASVFGRTGAVVAANGDYTASNITNVAAGNIAAVTVQAAIDELDSEKQAEVLTTRGDVVVRNATQTTRLALGASGTFFKSDGTDSVWSNVIDGGTA